MQSCCTIVNILKSSLFQLWKISPQPSVFSFFVFCCQINFRSVFNLVVSKESCAPIRYGDVQHFQKKRYQRFSLRKSNTSKHILVNKSSKTGWDAASSSSVTFSTTGVSSVKGGEGAAVADCALSSPQICESNGGSLYMDFGLLAMKCLRWLVWGWGMSGAGLKSYCVESLQRFIISPQFLFVSGVKMIINQLQR